MTPWSQHIEFDNGYRAKGALGFSFARNLTTFDPAGASVAVNTPRYDRSRAIASPVTFTQRLSSQGGLYAVLATGYDTDGFTPMCLTWSASTGTIRCHRGYELTVMYQSGNIITATVPDLFAGAISGYKIAPGYGFILDGTIVLYGEVFNDSGGYASYTASLVTSTNYGQTWSLIEATTGQFVTPVGSRGTPRGEKWCIKHPRPVTAVNGRMLTGWISFTDYIANAPSAGGASYAAQVSRSSVNAPWTFGRIKETFSQAASGLHLHSSGIVERDGRCLQLIAKGDGNYNELLVADFAAADYENAEVILHRGCQGSTTVSAAAPRSVQPAALVPGPGDSFLAAPDNESATVFRLTIPDPFVDTVTVEGLGEQLIDMLGTDTLTMEGRPEGPWIIARSNRFNGSLQGPSAGPAGMISYDGTNWTEISSPTVPTNLYGDAMLSFATAGTLSMAPLPPVLRTARPALVSPGGTNLAWLTPPFATADTGCVFELCGGSEGAWTWPASSGRSGLISPQPPCRGKCYYFSSAGVSRFVQNSGDEWDACTTGTRGRHWRLWVLPLRDVATFGVEIGTGASFSGYSYRSLGHHNKWTPLIQAHRANAGATDWHMRIVDSNNDAVHPDIEALFCYGEKVEDGFETYPLPTRTGSGGSAKTASPNEIAAVTGLSLGAAWTIAARLMVPEDYWDSRMMFQIFGASATKTLLTLYTDASNYISVNLVTGASEDALTTVQAVVTVAGSTAATIDLGANFWFNAGTQIHLAFSFDGTDLVFRFRANGEQEGTQTVAAPTPVAVRFSNAGQTAVVPMAVFDVFAMSQALDLASAPFNTLARPRSAASVAPMNISEMLALD